MVHGGLASQGVAAPAERTLVFTVSCMAKRPSDLLLPLQAAELAAPLGKLVLEGCAKAAGGCRAPS